MKLRNGNLALEKMPGRAFFWKLLQPKRVTVTCQHDIVVSEELLEQLQLKEWKDRFSTR